jgi:hypothetical protein
LRKQLEAIHRTARALALDVRLRREVPNWAMERAVEFVDHGLPPAFLDHLAANANRFEQALRDRTASRNARVAAGISLKTSLDRGLLAVRRLDAVVPNVLGEDPAALAHGGERA